jgi:thiol-disulfide isomerase/thioredoxin
MIRKLILITIFFVTVNFLGAQTTLTVAENFNIKTPTGETVNLFNILDGGQYAVIDFFNVTCGPCQTYAPDVQMSYTHFGSNEQEVFYMGISYSGNNQMIIEWDQTYGITFPTISGTEGGGYDVHIDYGIQTVPTIVLVAPNHDIIGQLHIPAYIPDVISIDSMLMAHGLNPVFTGDFSDHEVVSTQLNVYPNPASNYLDVSADINPDRETRIEVYSMTGMKMISENLSGNGSLQKRIDLQRLATGIYLVALIEDELITKHTKIQVIR